MVKIPPESSTFPGRGVSIKGVFYTRKTRKGVAIVRWPRQRPTPATAGEADSRKLIALAARVTTYMTPQEQDFARQVSNVTKLLPRDFLMLALFQRIGTFVGRDGKKRYSVAAMQDVSELLDALGQIEGMILYRDGTWWTGLAIGEANQVLSVSDEGLPAWIDLVQGSNGLEAFTMPPITPTLNTGLFGTGAFAGRSTYLPAGTVVNGVRVWCQNPNGPHTIGAALYAADGSTLDMGGGVKLAESPTAALALGLNSLPFTSQWTAPVSAFYWFGIGITGTGNSYFGAGDFARNNEYFTGVSFPLPNPAPSTTASSSVNTNWWLY